MKRTVLLAAGAVIALSAGYAWATTIQSVYHSGEYNPFQDAKILYSQNSDDTHTAVDSQNYTSGSSQYNDQGADDFVIPTGQIWRITEVDVTGVYFNGRGPATSENVVFYKNKNGMPGDPVRNGTFTNLNGTGGPNFALMLPGRGLRFKAGRYWVSVIENADEFDQGEWGWEVSNVQHGKGAMWQNPGGGFGECFTWTPIENCYQVGGPDFMFALKGRVR